MFWWSAVSRLFAAALNGHVHLGVLVVTLALVKLWFCIVSVQLGRRRNRGPNEKNKRWNKKKTLLHF